MDRRALLLMAAACVGLEGVPVERFGLFGKIIAKPGMRDAFIAVLTSGTSDMPGNELYVVSTSAGEPDAVYVMEVWRSEADHKASLQLESVRAAIAKGRSMIEKFAESVRLQPVSGKGLPTA